MRKRQQTLVISPFLEPHELKTFRSFVQEKARQLANARIDTRQQLQLLAELDQNLSAKAAILLYLQIFVNEPVTTQELEIISGISEYARRIRELTSEGYNIKTSTDHGAITYTFLG
jgi:hypothetical protein